MLFGRENLSDIKNNNHDHAYSRFSLHSIRDDTEDKLFEWVSNNINKYFFIEVRSDKDALKGKDIDHYRRFININELLLKLITYNFQIIYSELSRGFAPYLHEYGVNYNEEDPPIIRIVCKVNEN